MPTYCYQMTGETGCDRCRDGFEVVQSIKDSALETCPHCEGPIRRVLQAPFINTRPSGKTLLTDRNLKRHGFTRLVNEGDGKIRKI